MPRTLYCCGVSGFSSMFNLMIESASPLASLISSSAGPIALQGPHHSAQKSTRTGLSACRTSVEKSLSVVFEVAISKCPCQFDWVAHLVARPSALKVGTRSRSVKRWRAKDQDSKPPDAHPLTIPEAVPPRSRPARSQHHGRDKSVPEAQHKGPSGVYRRWA